MSDLPDQTATAPEAQAGSAQASPLVLQTREGRLFQLAGQGLLAYCLYNIAAVLLLSGEGPEVVFTRISQLVTLFPLVLLSGVLLFANAGRISSGNLIQRFTRWFVLGAAVMYLLFVPLIFLNEFHLYQQDTNQIQRLRTSLGKRKKEILNAVSEARTPEEFRTILERFPDISDIDIKDSETPAQIIRGITAGIDQGISAAVEPALSRLQLRIGSFSNTVRITALGSLISGVSLFALSLRLHDWLAPAGTSMQRTWNGMVKALLSLPRRVLPKAKTRSSSSPAAGPLGRLEKLRRSLGRSLRKLQRKTNQRKAANQRSSTRRKTQKRRERRRRRIQ